MIEKQLGQWSSRNILGDDYSYLRRQGSISQNTEIACTMRERKGEDVGLALQEKSVFGVFDGAGGHACGKEAAMAAAEGIKMYFSRIEDPALAMEVAVEDLKNAFRCGREFVNQFGENGSTTAAVAQLLMVNGREHMVWGIAGDSAIIVANEEGRIKFRSPEQCVKDRLTNGFVSEDWFDEELAGWVQKEDWFGQQDRFGHMELEKGDRIILVSDGITGDKDHERLRDDEWQGALARETADDIAQQLLEVSLKNDDKTVIAVIITNND